MIPYTPVEEWTGLLAEIYALIGTPEFWLAQIGWLSKVILTIVLAVAIGTIIRKSLRSWIELMGGDAQWRFAIPYAANGPLSAFVWLSALSIISKIIEERFGLNNAVGLFQRAQPILYIVIMGWFFLRLNRLMFREILPAKGQFTAASRDLGQKLGVSLIFLISALLMLPYFGVSPASLLTVGGIGGLVIGFASKDMLANYIGAIMLHFDQPFQVGDWVRVRERNVEGVVESIGWRQVVIRDLNKEMVYVPNSLFGTIVVENPGRMSHRRIKEYLTLRYEDLPKIPAIVAQVQNYLESCGYFDSTQDIVVRFEQFGESSLNIYMSAFTSTVQFPPYMKLREEVLLKIARIVHENGAAFAYPTRVIYGVTAS